MHIYDYIRKQTNMLPCTYKRIIDEQNLFLYTREERENEREREAHTRFSHSLRKNTIYIQCEKKRSAFAHPCTILNP
jgi:hypothetical protein